MFPLRIPNFKPALIFWGAKIICVGQKYKEKNEKFPDPWEKQTEIWSWRILSKTRLQNPSGRVSRKMSSQLSLNTEGSKLPWERAETDHRIKPQRLQVLDSSGMKHNTSICIV